MDFRPQSDAFKLQYEKFLCGCDALEEQGLWDKAAFGDMEAYFFTDIMSVILHLISTDGRFTEEEAEFVRDAFGFNYSVKDLEEIYRTNGENITQFFRESVPRGYREIKAINPKLGEHYKTMLMNACELATACDHKTDVEQQRIDALKAGLE